LAEDANAELIVESVITNGAIAWEVADAPIALVFSLVADELRS
jgi:hypothetical protein